MAMGRLASMLAALLLLLTFNAYACILPVQTADHMECDSPADEPARQTCDAFLELGPQSYTWANQDLPILKTLDVDAALPVPALIPIVVRLEHPLRGANTAIHCSIPTTVLRI